MLKLLFQIHKKKCVDHIDNNRTNNKVENLRWATHQENSFNRKINKNNTSGFKGVYYNKILFKWYSVININGKLKHLGYFDCKEEAIMARYNESKEIQKDFINECEINAYNISLLKVEKQKELKQLEELEKEFDEIIKNI